MSSLAEPERRDLARQSSGEHAGRYIRELIFNQDLRAGDRVPQDEVAHALGISRIPVREALIALEREGWITIEMHRGAFVNALDEQTVRDHYTLFGLIYGFATRRALARDGGTGELVATLDAVLGLLGEDDEPELMSRVAITFHRAIIAAARSPRIRTIISAMSGLVPGNFFAEVPGTMPVEREGLTTVIKAIRQGDTDAAEAGYDKMLRTHADLVVDMLRARGFFD